MTNYAGDLEYADLCLSCGLNGVCRKGDSGSSTFEICECCGIEFGYQDSTMEGVRAYREKWLSDGAQWFSPKEKPADWNLEKQLANLPERFR